MQKKILLAVLLSFLILLPIEVSAQQVSDVQTSPDGNVGGDYKIVSVNAVGWAYENSWIA